VCKKINERQYKYYQYTIRCIDAYLSVDENNLYGRTGGDVESLQKFISNLSKLDRGNVVLGDDFSVLVDGYKNHDISNLNYLRHKFDAISQKLKNELINE
jgi:hypothetical protein